LVTLLLFIIISRPGSSVKCLSRRRVDVRWKAESVLCRFMNENDDGMSMELRMQLYLPKLIVSRRQVLQSSGLAYERVRKSKVDRIVITIDIFYYNIIIIYFYIITIVLYTYYRYSLYSDLFGTLAVSNFSLKIQLHSFIRNYEIPKLWKIFLCNHLYLIYLCTRIYTCYLLKIYSILVQLQTLIILTKNII